MYRGDLINTQEACDLLDISKPTLSSYRKKYNVSHVKIKREVKFSKTEILTKLYKILNPLGEKVGFSIFAGHEFDVLKIDDTTYDLRKINSIDGHGAISLICHLVTEMNNGCFIHLFIDKTNTFLKAMNFFGELKRYLNSKVFWDEEIFTSIGNFSYDGLIKLPVRRLGVVGAHSTVADDLIISLSEQGYSRDICSYIGWAIGELADNSATHAKIHPSFIYFEQFGDDRRYLQLTIGDTGVGIPDSLKGNERYIDLTDKEALLTAFKPYVSGRPDEEERGKGLTDVLKISMECGSKMRVESNGIGYYYNFSAGLDNFEVITPLFKGNGTIISILFIDGNFGSKEREDVESYIDVCLGKI